VVPKEFVQMDSIPIGAWQSSLGNTSHYLDAGYLPQFPFGYGLSYTTFAYDEIAISPQNPGMGDQITIKAKITNTGSVASKETVQLYFRDVVGSLTRPVKELLRYKKIELAPGASKILEFVFSTDDFAFYGPDKKWITEAGEFRFWVAQHASDSTNEISVLIK